jgi:hypothetical protein
MGVGEKYNEYARFTLKFVKESEKDGEGEAPEIKDIEAAARKEFDDFDFAVFIDVTYHLIKHDYLTTEDTGDVRVYRTGKKADDIDLANL